MFRKSSSFGVSSKCFKYGIIAVPPASDSQVCLCAVHVVDFTGNWQAKLKSEQSHSGAEILCVLRCPISWMGGGSTGAAATARLPFFGASSIPCSVSQFGEEGA